MTEVGLGSGWLIQTVEARGGSYIQAFSRKGQTRSGGGYESHMAVACSSIVPLPMYSWKRRQVLGLDNKGKLCLCSLFQFHGAIVREPFLWPLPRAGPLCDIRRHWGAIRRWPGSLSSCRGRPPSRRSSRDTRGCSARSNGAAIG